MTPSQIKADLAMALARLERIVCVVPPDAGVVLLSQDGTTHIDWIDGRWATVYDHEYFSPLGDELIALHKQLQETMDRI
jgi:hypothetical protein